jgi:hypothetical protein
VKGFGQITDGKIGIGITDKHPQQPEFRLREAIHLMVFHFIHL